MVPLTAPLLGGIFFGGAYFPQKLTPKTSTEPRYKLFQRHVSFYILKRSPVCFVWDAPPLHYNIALNNLNIRGYRENRCKVLAARRYLV
jgi:hypothetical protein